MYTNQLNRTTMIVAFRIIACKNKYSNFFYILSSISNVWFVSPHIWRVVYFAGCFASHCAINCLSPINLTSSHQNDTELNLLNSSQHLLEFMNNSRGNSERHQFCMISVARNNQTPTIFNTNLWFFCMK